jgi:phenylacetate-coenzyme A ligase PaaK-like adenylate-forming protein
MPRLTKDDLRKFSPSGFLGPGCDLAAGLAGGEVEYVMTSGSTEDRVTNLWRQRWWDASERASWKLNAVAASTATGAHREAILTSPLCAGVLCENGSLPMEQRMLGRFLFLNEIIDPAHWGESHLDRMVDELNTFEPVVLEANPTLLGKLARHIADHGKAVVQPRLIILTYEYPSRIHCRQIGRVFNAPVVSSYGTTETGYVFMECEAGRLHQNVDFCRVDFQPLKAEHGGPLIGQILVTTFRNPWSVMLRFLVGDLVRLEERGTCPCGRSEGLILASIEGRIKNITRRPEGGVVTQRLVDASLSHVTGIAEYQLRQTDTDAYCLSLVKERDAPPQIGVPASDVLHDLYGKKAKVSVNFVKSLPLDGAPKYQLAKSYLPFDIDECLLDGRNPWNGS